MKILRKGILNIYDLNGNKVVNTREIHSKVSTSKDFHAWIRTKIKSLDLIEDIDYVTIAQKTEIGKKNRITLEYFVNIDTALSIIDSVRKSKMTLELYVYLANTAAVLGCSTNKEVQLELELTNNESNKNLISSFTDEVFGHLTVIKTNEDKILFKANDVLRALGYSESGWSKTLSRKCKWMTKCHVPHPQNPQKEIEMNFIPQSDVLRLIMGSKLPSAERFEAWVVEDIAPSVLKHGFYATSDTVEAFLNDPDAAIKIFENYKKEKEEKEKLLIEKKQNEYKVFAYEDFINSNNSYNFAITAKILSIPRTPYSDKFVGKNTLLAWLRRDGILISSKGEDRNTPYQKYINRGWFNLIVDLTDGKPKGSPVVRVTPKGIEGLYKKYRYSNMPKAIDINNIKNSVTLNNEEHLDIAL